MGPLIRFSFRYEILEELSRDGKQIIDDLRFESQVEYRKIWKLHITLHFLVIRN